MELFGIDSDSDSLLEFSLCFLGEGHPEIQDNIYNFLRITMNSIRINYIQQPILRIIDFLMNFIIDIPLPQEEKPVQLIRYEEALETVSKPHFTTIQVEIAHPKICLSHLPKASSYLVLDLGTISVYNQVEMGTERLLEKTQQVEHHYNERYLLKFNDIHIYRVTPGGVMTSMSENIQLSIEIEQCKFVDELKLIMNHDLKLPYTYMPLKNDRYIDCNMSSLDMRLSRAVYVELLDCVAHNITNDDDQDGVYTFNPKVLIEDAPFIKFDPNEDIASNFSRFLTLITYFDSTDDHQPCS